MPRQHFNFFKTTPRQKIYIKKEIKYKKKLKSDLIKKNYYLSLLFFIRTLQIVLRVLPRSNPATKKWNPDHNNTNKKKKKKLKEKSKIIKKKKKKK